MLAGPPSLGGFRRLKNIFMRLIFLLFFLTQICFSQVKSGEIVYGEKYIRELDTTGIKSKFRKKFKLKRYHELKKIIPYLSYSLNFNKNEAEFQLPEGNGMKNDNGLDLNLGVSASSATGVFYINLKDNLIIHQKNAFDKDFRVKTLINDYDWAIHSEEKIISGYKCKKATTTVNLNSSVTGEVTAWFAPDLPFQFGPLGFGGLPGMILGLERAGCYFYAEEINLKETPKNIKRPQKGKLLTERKYYKTIKKLNPYEN